MLNTWFTGTTLGMPGDEDGGGMSAFVVFSMMGFYPVTPGVPVYNICSPVFDKVTIRLDNGKSFSIVCRDNSTENKYIQSIHLNGKPLNQVWFRHADLVDGGRLELQMAGSPNETLGADPETYPPSTMATVRPRRSSPTTTRCWVGCRTRTMRSPSSGWTRSSSNVRYPIAEARLGGGVAVAHQPGPEQTPPGRRLSRAT